MARQLKRSVPSGAQLAQRLRWLRIRTSVRPDAEEATDALDAWRELQRGALAVPRLEGGAHLRVTLVPLE